MVPLVSVVGDEGDVAVVLAFDLFADRTVLLVAGRMQCIEQ